LYVEDHARGIDLVIEKGKLGETYNIGGINDYEPKESFESGISKTIDWYLTNNTWWESVLDGSYRAEK